MPFPFAFEGRIRPLPYALSSIVVFFSQYAVVYAVAKTYGRGGALDWWPWSLMPLRALVTHGAIGNAILLAILAYFLIAGWALAALAFRRAADADISEWIALFAVAPIVQVPAVLVLSVLPTRSPSAQARPVDRLAAATPDWAAAAQGVLAGMALTLFAVAVGALVFGTYGYGMFVLSPFIIGVTTAYIANRKTDLGGSNTAHLVMAATVLGGIALVLVALEGIVCIVMAAPLGIGIAVVGGLLGRAIALSTRRPTAQSLSGLALLPVVFGLEAILPATTNFDSFQTIAIDAPPELVWRSIVRMETIDEPRSLPFRLGVAYPLRGEVIGEGVGATRRSEFSTGTLLERVTEWIPQRKLAFVVLQDVPAMRELSPYQHVHAPHVVGYFRTMHVSFELVPRSDGGTDLNEHTSHELKLEPVLYWLPIARWVVQANNARVLAHIRARAEQRREN
jgi:uncharacterized membrane protein YhaH (DUF805 family)